MNTVETVYSLNQVYWDAEIQRAQTLRFHKLSTEFSALFKDEPAFYARAPGRVNLIGEHVDYSLYGVLPMALSDKDIIIAISPRSSSGSSMGMLRLHNLDSSVFPPCSFDFSRNVSIDATKHEWSNYFIASLKIVLDEYPELPRYGLDCVISGSVPAGAGVSSSAAFVSCACLAILRALGIKHVDKRKLVELAIKSEHAVGVETGGMDQSASVFGIQNHALGIDFYPALHVESVPFPTVQTVDEEPVFVVAHSLVNSDKHVTAPVCYNLRVVETRFSALLLSKLCGIDDWKSVLTLRVFHEKHLNLNSLSLLSMVEALEKMKVVVEDKLERKDGYKIEEIAALLEISVDELKKYINFPIRAEKFQLYRRSKHVFSEALRVYQFREICKQGNTPSDTNLMPKLPSSPPAETTPISKSYFETLGKLMNESQESCNELFDCSCPELNQLTKICRENGAIGSRLTGAGWGGCTVSLVTKGHLGLFLESIKEKYYKGKDLKGKSIEDVLFFSPPGRGAVLIQLDI